MTQLVLIALSALVLGGVFGWSLRALIAPAREGIQWELNDAARRGDVNHMKRLIANGANPLIQAYDADTGPYGGSPLFEAASSGAPESTEFLIKQGADVNAIVATESPLDMALYRRSQADETATLLIESGAKGFAELVNPEMSAARKRRQAESGPRD